MYHQINALYFSFLSIFFPFSCLPFPMHVSALRHYTAQGHKYFYIHLQLCNERSGFAKFDHVFLTPGIASDLMRNYYSLDLLTHETLEKSAD